jgi:MFS transporter, MHS family, citrate/tricarballylate:H+ symporter
MSVDTMGAGFTSAARRRQQMLNVIRVAGSNFLEQYDVFVYGFYASYIGHAFFPTDDPWASLQSTATVCPKPLP